MSIAPPQEWLAMGPGPRLHLHLDFDGTLVPIAADPDRCHPDPTLRRLLEALAHHPGVAMAILSGRSLADLSARVPVRGVALAGNHGLEIAVSGRCWRHPGAVALRPRLERLARLARQRLAGLPGAFVEDKVLSLSLHHRRVPPARRGDLRQRLRQLEAELARWQRIRTHRGKEVLEIRPDLYWSKGSAARLLCRRWPAQKGNGAYFYAGDDDTDEDVFRAFPWGITVKIGPRHTPSTARFRLADPAALRRLLETLLRRLSSHGSGADMGL